MGRITSDLILKIIKNIVLVIIIGALLAGGYYLFYGKGKQEEKTRQKEKAVLEQKISDFAGKYGALVDWEKDMDYDSFTSEFQDKLISTRPFLFKGKIDDIYYKNEKTFIRVISLHITDFQGYVLELECNKDIVEKILSQISGEHFRSWKDFAIVATINKVSKPVFEFNYLSEAEEKVLVDRNTLGMFVAEGVCIDAERVE